MCVCVGGCQGLSLIQLGCLASKPRDRPLFSSLGMGLQVCVCVCCSFTRILSIQIQVLMLAWPSALPTRLFPQPLTPCLYKVPRNRLADLLLREAMDQSLGCGLHTARDWPHLSGEGMKTIQADRHRKAGIWWAGLSLMGKLQHPGIPVCLHISTGR